VKYIMTNKEEDKAISAGSVDTAKEQPAKAPEPAKEIYKADGEELKHKEHVHDHSCRHDHSHGGHLKDLPAKYFSISS